MNRRILTLIFAFLLLVLVQAEHALGHLGEWIHAPHDGAIQLPDP